MRQWIGSALVQITACRLFGAKPLSETMLGYCQPDLRNKLQWNFNQITKLSIHENAYKISSLKRRPFVQGGDELILISRMPRCHTALLRWSRWFGFEMALVLDFRHPIDFAIWFWSLVFMKGACARSLNMQIRLWFDWSLSIQNNKCDRKIIHILYYNQNWCNTRICC